MEHPTGNYYDKYNSKNKIEKLLMDNFFKSLSYCLNSIDFENVLEAGCGEGKVINYISKSFKFAGGGRNKLQAFDIGTNEINEAKKNFPHINFFEKSIYKSGYSDNSFDLVVCCEVLEHLDNYEKALKELIRISKKYVLISVPREPLWRFLNICRMKYIKDFGNTPGHINHWSSSRIKILAEQYGTILKYKKPLPWTMILIKVN